MAKLSAERMQTILRYQRDIRRLQKETQKLPGALRRDVQRIVDRRRDTIRGLILETVQDPESPIPARSANGLGNRIAAEVRAMQDEVAAEVSLGQRTAWEDGVKAGNSLLRAATLEESAFFSPSAELFNIATKHSADLIVTAGREYIPRINAMIARGVLGGLTPFQVMEQMDKLLGNTSAASGIHRARADLGGIAYQSERIVRTEVNRVYSIALDSFNGELVQRLGPEASKKLKKRWVFGTWREGRREDHRDIDGEEVPFDEEFSNGLKYPRDPAAWDKPEQVINCACTWVISADSVEEAALSALDNL
ncbi:MAG: hypothetical protein IPK72_21170 [Candidatus Eisenbacteria bacterium]|nr:hypothetical protein [Candidatus Eisenbacteria bacterium]